MGTYGAGARRPHGEHRGGCARLAGADTGAETANTAQTQQARPRSHRLCALLQLLARVPQGQGGEALHCAQHRRGGCRA